MSRRRRTHGLLVDWDGTILDSFSAQVRATKDVFVAYGVEWCDERFQRYPTDWRGHYLDAGIEQAQLLEASTVYRQAYERQPTRLRPHARRVLRNLAAARVPLALVTSGTRVRVAREMSRSGLAEVITHVVTYDDVDRPKPSPEGFHFAMKLLGLDSDQVTAIGDTAADEAAAQAAGIACLLIRSRFTQPPIPASSVTGWLALEQRLQAMHGFA
jgi:pyrophosphatase PpaX